MECEDVLGAEIAEEQRDLIPDVRQYRRHEHDGDNTDDDAANRQERPSSGRAKRVERERRRLADQSRPA